MRYQRTRGGREITTFVKDSRAPADIYATTIAPYYKASVYCQTWLRGEGQFAVKLLTPPNVSCLGGPGVTRVVGGGLSPCRQWSATAKCVRVPHIPLVHPEPELLQV